MSNRSDRQKSVSLAIQGGGARGAYVWGILDRLLEDERLHVEGISGTSSGAINAALVVHGLNEGGPDRARELLREFWRRVSRVFVPRKRRWKTIARMMGKMRRDGFTSDALLRLIALVATTSDLDPVTMEPLRGVIDEMIDFERLGCSGPTKLFINATNVNTNQIRVFHTAEVTIDALCASSCLPLLCHPVRIGSDDYWDGAFLGNPAIYPLIYECETSDIVLLQSSPVFKPGLPRTAGDLIERFSEISFASTLLREMRAISLISGLIAKGQIHEQAGMRQIRMHMIAAEPVGETSATANRFDTTWPVLLERHRTGRERAEAWLASTFDDLGEKPTLDIDGALS